MFDEKITFDKFIRWFLVAALIFAVFYVLNYLSHVLLPFFIAWFIAYLLNPVVKFVQYKLRVKVRAIAVIITMLLVVTGISCVVYAIVPPMIDQAERLGDAANKYVLHTANGNRIMVMVREWIQEYLPQIRHYSYDKEFHTKAVFVLRADSEYCHQHNSIVYYAVVSVLYPARLRATGQKLHTHLPEGTTTLLDRPDARRRSRTE